MASEVESEREARTADGGGVRTRESSRAAKTKRQKGIKLFIRDIIIIVLAALLISFLIKTFLVRSFYIPSSSMEQTLRIDDRIIVNQLEPSLIPIAHGDIVVFRDPGGWLSPSAEPEQNAFVAGADAVMGFIGLSAPDSNDHLIKRVIGLPGDTVECCSAFGQIVVNGVPLEEPYINLPAGESQATRDNFTVTVPEGYIWVMGDNRWNSADSAFHRNDPSGGFVPIDNVVGRALFISWPSEHWAWLDNYPLTFAGVEPE